MRTDFLQRHFKEVYNIDLKSPKVFGIITGSKERKVVYPAELCTVEAGQFYKKKVPTELTKSVVDFATKSPQERLHTINSGIGLGQQGGLAAPVSDTMLLTTENVILITHNRPWSIRHLHSSRMPE
jgi:hypothetical protein